MIEKLLKTLMEIITFQCYNDKNDAMKGFAMKDESIFEITMVSMFLV